MPTKIDVLTTCAVISTFLLFFMAIELTLVLNWLGYIYECLLDIRWHH